MNLQKYYEILSCHLIFFKTLIYTNRHIYSHCSSSCMSYLQISLLAKICNLWPQNPYLLHFVVACGHVQSIRNLAPWTCSQLKLNKLTLCLLSAFIPQPCVLLEIHLMSCFSLGYHFCWWFCCLKCFPNWVLKCCLLKEAMECLTEKMSYETYNSMYILNIICIIYALYVYMYHILGVSKMYTHDLYSSFCISMWVYRILQFWCCFFLS